MPEWKDTVNLPRTEFPMKANLPTSEPETLARWSAMDLYGRIQAARAGRPILIYIKLVAPRQPIIRRSKSDRPAMLSNARRKFLFGTGGEAGDTFVATVDLQSDDLRAVSVGETGVPAMGMGAISDQIAAHLSPGTVRLNTRVASVTSHSVTTVTGVAAHIATDPLSCVAKGTGIALEHFDQFAKSMTSEA